MGREKDREGGRESRTEEERRDGAGRGRRSGDDEFLHLVSL